MLFTIIHGKCTDSLHFKLGGDIKYYYTKRNQDKIGMLRIVKRVMLKFEGNKELYHIMWEGYKLMF